MVGIITSELKKKQKLFRIKEENGGIKTPQIGRAAQVVKSEQINYDQEFYPIPSSDYSDSEK